MQKKSCCDSRTKTDTPLLTLGTGRGGVRHAIPTLTFLTCLHPPLTQKQRRDCTNQGAANEERK